MIWYEKLYIGESISKKRAKLRRIKKKVNRNAFLWNIFLIVLCRYGSSLLEIIPARELCQKNYPKQDLYIVGIAKGYQEALETAAKIVTDVYKKTGGFQVKSCLMQQKKAGDGT